MLKNNHYDDSIEVYKLLEEDYLNSINEVYNGANEKNNAHITEEINTSNDTNDEKFEDYDDQNEDNLIYENQE